MQTLKMSQSQMIFIRNLMRKIIFGTKNKHSPQEAGVNHEVGEASINKLEKEEVWVCFWVEQTTEVRD